MFNCYKPAIIVIDDQDDEKSPSSTVTGTHSRGLDYAGDDFHPSSYQKKNICPECVPFTEDITPVVERTSFATLREFLNDPEVAYGPDTVTDEDKVSCLLRWIHYTWDIVKQTNKQTKS